MATDILNNCFFDLTRIKKLYIGVPLSYPIFYNTITGSNDSIIAYYSPDMSYITIGG